MRSALWTALALTVALSAAGCRGGGFGSVSQRPIFGGASEPPLVVGSAEGGSVVESNPPSVIARSSPTFVDRHPLFARPRDMYESTNGNTLVKTGSAVLIGVPTGLFGEIRQVVLGVPPGGAAGPSVGSTR